MSNDVYIGVDLGGTRVRAARFSTDLEMLARTEAPSLARVGKEAVIERIYDVVQAVWPTDGSKVLGIGVTAPGPTNPRTGIIISLTNFVGWHDVPLRDLFQSKFSVPTYLGNDANLAALAETELGAARGYHDVVFLTISTGIGGGVISDGKMLIGADGLGAECGHIIMVVEGDHVSTFEKEAAGPAIARYAQIALQNGEKSSILDLTSGSIDEVNAKHVSDAAKSGDALGKRIMTRTGYMIGLGIVSHLHIFNPQIVVLGGGVVEGAWELLEGPMHEAIQQHSLVPEYWTHLKITLAGLGENVSLIGAAALARQQGAE